MRRIPLLEQLALQHHQPLRRRGALPQEDLMDRTEKRKIKENIEGSGSVDREETRHKLRECVGG
jgi:hypothetical protein